MKLSIIIVNYNVKYLLEQCLLSVQASETSFRYEVILVDNNSSDGSVEYISVKFPGIKIIANKNNPGFAKANNQAFKQATGEYILILNPDTVLSENTLQETCDFLDSNPGAGAVSVKMINGHGLFNPESKRGFPTPWNSFCKMSGLSRLFPQTRIFGQYNLAYLHEDEKHQVDILVGAFILTRKSIIEKIGLFDESFFMYGEDIDFSYRIVQSGYKNYYLPLKIIHYKGESTKKDDLRYVKIFYEAMYIFFRKHYPDYGKIYSLFVTAGIYSRAALSGLKRFSGKFTGARKKENKIVVLSRADYSFKEIIDIMDKGKDKNTEYRIYNPQTGMVVGSHFAGKTE